ncbi:DUF2845 domain-containing protein [Rhodanobacter sp. C01]|uniref:DUF2845 domain-containing protein n=1 Tax=Rhodanobacter sp. C01 TaxID=1945856 RepID=UPI000984F814|nr:DUF2845 domain-containing protein [Rhodanobacter sp. C01]OOG51291.1 hypothetical protein B0E50_00825 [Rhodanobacter sp. C01]
MRIRLIVALFVFSTAVQASTSMRVGSQVLVVGDSAVRVTELLGKPSYKSRGRGSRSSGSRKSGRGSHGRSRAAATPGKDAGGEKWQYRRGDHVTIVTLVDGKVSNIEDERR